jgi:hypothetical protein
MYEKLETREMILVSLALVELFLYSSYLLLTFFLPFIISFFRSVSLSNKIEATLGWLCSLNGDGRNEHRLFIEALSK